MVQPVLLAIDDDESLLGDIERELRDRYARHYQVVCVRSPAEARAHLTDFAASGVEVALVLAARSAAEVPTNSLLAEVRQVHPRAKRALVVAFGDWGQKAVGDEIFEGVADGRFDHYVLRPAESPDELFHQTISSMLLEWWEANRAAPHMVHIVGESWTGRAYELREALKQSRRRRGIAGRSSLRQMPGYGKFNGDIDRPLLADSVEKLQFAFAPNACGGALLSTIRSTNRWSVC